MLPSNKQRQNSTNIEIQEDCVDMESKSCIKIKELHMSEGWFVYAVLLKHYYFIMNVAGVNCRTSGMLKFDSF